MADPTTDPKLAQKDVDTKGVHELERVTSDDGYYEKNGQDYGRMDAEVAKYADGDGVVITEEENKRLKRLIDKRVLFIMVLTYFQQALDKGTLSFTSVSSGSLAIPSNRKLTNIFSLDHGYRYNVSASESTLKLTVLGIREDLGLEGDKWPWLTTCIYLAILVVEYPINWLIQRLPIAKFLGTCIMIWGSVLMLHVAARNFTHMVVLRTILGAFEAVCQPTFLVMSGMWYDSPIPQVYSITRLLTFPKVQA